MPRAEVTRRPIASEGRKTKRLVHRTRSRNLDTRYLPRQEVQSLVLLIYLPTPTYPRSARTVHSRHQDRSRALRCAVRSRTSPAPLCKALAPGTASYCQRYKSEEHTSELQSLMRISYAVFCLKNKTK